MQDFKSATTGVAAKTMRNELNRMVQGVTDPAKRKVSYPVQMVKAACLLLPASGRQLARCNPTHR
jgi:hypothetical protein